MATTAGSRPATCGSPTNWTGWARSGTAGPGWRRSPWWCRRREVLPKLATVERWYYVSSRAGTDAAAMAAAIRGHWSVENNLHRALDVSFGEDGARHRNGHSAENFSRLRRIGLNLLSRDQSKKRGVKGKRLNAAWDHDYLLKLLAG